MRFLLRCRPQTIKPPTGKKVAVIGAGPAGLGVAAQLRCFGHEVHVYDALPEPGGLLLFGIPAWRLNKDDIRLGVKELVDIGVKFHNSIFVFCGDKKPTKDEDLAVVLAKEFTDLNDLISQYDATVIATGTWKEREKGSPGENLPGVYGALEFLFRIYLYELKYASKEQMFPVGSRALVVGGGLTAIDAAVEAQLYGAKKVVVAYRRTLNEAPAGKTEIERNLLARGIEFRELLDPIRFEGKDKLEKVVFIKMKLGAPDKSGRPHPEPIPGSEFEEEFDTVLLAIGEIPTPPFKNGCAGIQLTRWNTIDVDNMFRTTRKGVFAVGDVAHGPSLIGKALGAGVRAAPIINDYLEGKLNWR